MENFDKFWHLLPKKDADIYFVSRMNFKFVKTLVEHEQPLNLRVISIFFHICRSCEIIWRAPVVTQMLFDCSRHRHIVTFYWISSNIHIRCVKLFAVFHHPFACNCIMRPYSNLLIFHPIKCLPTNSICTVSWWTFTCPINGWKSVKPIFLMRFSNEPTAMNIGSYHWCYWPANQCQSSERITLTLIIATRPIHT